MREEQVRKYESQSIKIMMKSGDLFTGCLKIIGTDFLVINDKYGNDVNIALDSISFIKPVGVKR
jgi:hypothetical protein